MHSAPTCHLHYLHIIPFSAHLHSHSFSVYLHSHSFSIYPHLCTKSTHLNSPNCLLRHILMLTLSQQIYTLILAANEWLKKRRKFILASAPFPLWKICSLIYTVHNASKILSCHPPSIELHSCCVETKLSEQQINIWSACFQILTIS